MFNCFNYSIPYGYGFLSSFSEKERSKRWIAAWTSKRKKKKH